MLCDRAVEKWKNFHSDTYDESQQYNILFEDGQQALYIPGTKEAFTLKRYHDELGKDFKSITLFLCSELDFLQAEGLLLNDDVHFACDSEADVGSFTNNEPEPKNIPPAKCARIANPENIDLTVTSSNGQSSLNYGSDKPSQIESSDGPSQIELDHRLANELQDMFDDDDFASPSVSESNKEPPKEPGDVVKMLGVAVDSSDEQMFIVIRRNAQLNRALSIWQREVKKNPASNRYIVRVKFSGENGIDSGALAKEFFTLTFSQINKVLFPNGKPLDSTYHIQNGNFKACGEIMAASLAQGGPAPSFLDESVFNLMVNPNMSLQELDPAVHLTSSDRSLLDSVKKNVTLHSDTIIEHGYTGKIDDAHIDDIIQSTMVSIVTKRLVYLRELIDGLDSYGLKDILNTHPSACKDLFVHHNKESVDANYVFSILQPVYAEPMSTRRRKEESVMDFFQDFLFGCEDESNVPGGAEVLATNDSEDESMPSVTDDQQLADCSAAGIMGWLTGQKHRPLDGDVLAVRVKFDHDCLVNNPHHRICFPFVRACAKEVTLPVAHMNTAEEFNEILTLAVSKGQAFGCA